MTHAYISTACQHGVHSRCALICKFCGVACQCDCGHSIEDDTSLREYLARGLEVRYPHLAVGLVSATVVELLREVPRSS